MLLFTLEYQNRDDQFHAVSHFLLTQEWLESFHYYNVWWCTTQVMFTYTNACSFLGKTNWKRHTHSQLGSDQKWRKHFLLLLSLATLFLKSNSNFGLNMRSRSWLIPKWIKLLNFWREYCFTVKELAKSNKNN